MFIATSSSPVPTETTDGPHTVVPAGLLRSYRQTRYTADGIDIRVGHRSVAMDSWLIAHGARMGVLITAWNPLSHRMPHGWNERMQHHLAEHMHRYRWVAGAGRLRGWHEEAILALAPRRPAERIAMRFRQRGIILVQWRHPARLVILPARSRPL